VCSLLNCVLSQVSKGCTHLKSHVLEPLMHLPWLIVVVTPLLPIELSYFPLYEIVVKVLLYDPLLGLLHQTIWGLIGTSYWGDPLTCWRVQHYQHFCDKRRAIWQVEPSSSVLNLHTSIKESIIAHPSKCLSNGHIFHVEREFWNHLSQLMYDGEGEVAWPEHLDDFHALMEYM